jgi:hypothetical protein
MRVRNLEFLVRWSLHDLFDLGEQVTIISLNLLAALE